MSRLGDPVPRRFSDETRRLLYALSAFAAVMIVGVCGFLLLENDWTVQRAFYFTVITLSTVGYGDEGISEPARMFSSVLILMGIGTCTYTLSQLVQFAVSRQLAWRQKMQRHIDRMQDHFVICGLGRLGQAVCDRFGEASMPVVVVERDPERAQWARDREMLVVEGSATEDDTLILAGVARARGIVCASPNDSDNLAMTLTARELNPDMTIIARIDNPKVATRFKRAGATSVISPATLSGHDIATMLIRPKLADFLQRARTSESGYQLTEVEVDPGSPLLGQSLEQLGVRERDLAFVALQPAGGVAQVRPDASHILAAGDSVIVAGSLEALARMAEQGKGLDAIAAAG